MITLFYILWMLDTLFFTDKKNKCLAWSYLSTLLHLLFIWYWNTYISSELDPTTCLRKFSCIINLFNLYIHIPSVLICLNDTPLSYNLPYIGQRICAIYKPEPLLGTAHPSAVFYMGKLFYRHCDDNTPLCRGVKTNLKLSVLGRRQTFIVNKILHNFWSLSPA